MEGGVEGEREQHHMLSPSVVRLSPLISLLCVCVFTAQWDVSQCPCIPVYTSPAFSLWLGLQKGMNHTMTWTELLVCRHHVTTP